MMMELNLHGEAHAVVNLADLQQALAAACNLAQCELWLTMAVNPEQGPALCLLRNGGNAWLMYLCGQDESSFHSLGDDEDDGVCSYWLANGQVDEYPSAWCIEVELAQLALLKFFETGGARPDVIDWEPD
ncbi:Imm1 family immunity protein [Janthinobacterium sp. Mn2066]|uniref:Imm1 family immunity protein n=1 Tax=Janthinobacterium sp. Mn2066 TaxID=3395264 RepID=UPI003BD6AEBD